MPARMTKKTAAKKSSKAKKSTDSKLNLSEVFTEILKVTMPSKFAPAPEKLHDRHFKVRLPSGAEAEHKACGIELGGGALVFSNCDRILIAYGPSQWLTFEELVPVVPAPAVPAEPPAPVVQA